MGLIWTGLVGLLQIVCCRPVVDIFQGRVQIEGKKTLS